MSKSKKAKSDGVSATPEIINTAFPGGFTLRDEANALTAFAFRNGILEDMHAGATSPLLDDPNLSRLTNEEMKALMIEASEKLAFLLQLRETDVGRYQEFVRAYGFTYCIGWER